MSQNKIKWDVVEKMAKIHGEYAIGRPMAYPDVTNPIHSIFTEPDVEWQPKWSEVNDKIMVSTAITGSFYNKNGNPNHPVSMEEIYRECREACLAGAPILHLHVRDENGMNVLDARLLKDLFNKIKDEFPDVAIDSCLVPHDEGTWEHFMEMIESGLIDSTPVNTSAVYCGDSLLLKYPHVVMNKTKVLLENDVRTRVAVYCDGDIDNANNWLFRPGLMETSKTGKPSWWGILPALPGGTPMHNPKAMIEGYMHLVNRINEIDDNPIIQCCASGRASSYLATLAILMGHHLRIGMEDTVWKWPHKNQMVKSNAEQFRETKELCELLGRDVMTSQEYREFMGINNK